MRRFDGIRVGVRGAVGELLLDRPEKLNALSRAVLEELIEAAAWFDAREEVRAVVVRGAGRAFCGGADLAGMRPDGADESRQRRDLDLGRRMTEAIADMRALTVAAIHGHCVGGGVVLATACDLRIAADDVRFAIPEVDLGIPLTWSGIPRLVREIGPALTKDLVLTCRPFDAQEALRIGFVSRVVALDELETEAFAVAESSRPSPRACWI